MSHCFFVDFWGIRFPFKNLILCYYYSIKKTLSGAGAASGRVTFLFAVFYSCLSKRGVWIRGSFCARTVAFIKRMIIERGDESSFKIAFCYALRRGVLTFFHFRPIEKTVDVIYEKDDKTDYHR